MVTKNYTDKINFLFDKLNKLIENETTKLDRLMDNYLDETIDINLYDMFQKKLSSRIEKYFLYIVYN